MAGPYVRDSLAVDLVAAGATGTDTEASFVDVVVEQIAGAGAATWVATVQAASTSAFSDVVTLGVFSSTTGAATKRLVTQIPPRKRFVRVSSTGTVGASTVKLHPRHNRKLPTDTA